MDSLVRESRTQDCGVSNGVVTRSFAAKAYGSDKLVVFLYSTQANMFKVASADADVSTFKSSDTSLANRISAMIIFP